jgi:hypothetical protein
LFVLIQVVYLSFQDNLQTELTDQIWTLIDRWKTECEMAVPPDERRPKERSRSKTLPVISVLEILDSAGAKFV